MYRIEFLPSAARALANLPVAVQRRIARRLDRLGEDPRPADARPLRGSADVLRVRVGDYRILYQVEEDRLVVLIIRLGHRREIYR